MLSLLRRAARRHYHTLTPEDYLFNQRDATLASQPQTKTLNVLPGSNQGPEDIADEVGLVGVPKGIFPQKFKQYDYFQRQLMKHESQLIFLQVDPSDYIARERFAAHKCALSKVEDYYVDGVHTIDPIKPITWQETVVNLLTLDMINQNKIPDNMVYSKGLYTFSYEHIQDKSVNKDLTPIFIQAIGNHVLGGRRTEYAFIDKVLYAALMGRHKVMLGGMPETLRRLILGNSLSIHELRDVFRFVLTKNKELSIPMRTGEATESFLPHIFQLPKDLYMTAMLKQSFQATTDMIAFVGMEHWVPMQKYWVGAPHGINVTQATRIPDRLDGQTDEDLIEKQAIMQVLFDTRTWGKKYLSNPFPYLVDDITKLEDKDANLLKSTFKKHYTKYKLFKDREYEKLQLRSQMPDKRLEHKTNEEVRKVQETLLTAKEFNRYHLKDRPLNENQREL